MKAPYVFSLSKDVVVRDTYNHLPNWCSFPLRFAKDHHYIRLDQTEIFTQKLSHQAFFIELTQVMAPRKIRIPFVVDERQLFLYFSLKGDHRFLTTEKTPITTVKENTFLMSYYDEGEYYLELPKGKHTALIVSLSPEWLDEISIPYPRIRNVLSTFMSESDQFKVMYHSKITNRIKSYLDKIHSFSQKNPGALDGILRLYISYVLEYYDSSLYCTKQKRVDKIKKHIEERYTEENLTVESIASYHKVTPRTLLNQFKSRQGITVKDYITELRLEEAIRLMEQYKLPKREVFSKVGYTDVGTFRTALVRYKRKKEQLE